MTGQQSAFATTYIPQTNSNTEPDRWLVTAKRVLRYLKETLPYGLTHPRINHREAQAIEYADAS